MQDNEILKDLNPAQRQAVQAVAGPLLILAGAGSGKTKTLTHRIAYIIQNDLAKPNQIMAVTFTNKAAGEMRQRLASLLGKNNDRGFMPWMGTFHSIAVRLLRIYGDAINIDRNFVILDETDRLSIIKAVMKNLGINDKSYKPRTMQSYISNAKNAGLSPEQYDATTKTPMQQVAAQIYFLYEKERRAQKGLDFDDLLLETWRLLSEKSDIRKRLQEQFKYILIDEYQDTNKVQYKIVKLLLNKEQNICAVGDDWQSIYSWRGADFTNILRFEQDFRGAEVIKLEQNYRSTNAILNAAHNVICKNQKRTDKKLWTKKSAGTPVRIKETRNEFNEAEFVINEINQAVSLGYFSLNDFAILYRTNAQSRVFEQMLNRYGMNYQIIGGLRFYDRAEIKDITAYLRLIYQPYDLVSFKRIANVPRRSLGEVSLSKFIEFHITNQTDLIESLVSADKCSSLTPRASQAFIKLGNDLKDLRELALTASPDILIQKIIETFNYDDYINDGTEVGETKLKNIGELINMAKDFADLGSFLEEVGLISGADKADDGSSVSLMTVHAAKGLEFPVVFMVGMEDGIFPSSRSEIELDKSEEERRLCYVGMTRAKEELTLTFADSRMLHGEVRHSLPSRFLSDIDEEFKAIKLDPVRSYGGGDNNNWLKNRLDNKANRDDEPRFVPDDEEGLNVDDVVQHQLFGRGKVKSIMGTVIEVDFDDGRRRKLNVAFAPLQKL